MLAIRDDDWFWFRWGAHGFVIILALPGLCRQNGSDAAPLVVDVGRPTDAGNNLFLPNCPDDCLPYLCENSLIISSGDTAPLLPWHSAIDRGNQADLTAFVFAAVNSGNLAR
jgi:hypothetical protein